MIGRVDGQNRVGYLSRCHQPPVAALNGENSRAKVQNVRGDSSGGNDTLLLQDAHLHDKRVWSVYDDVNKAAQPVMKVVLGGSL